LEVKDEQLNGRINEIKQKKERTIPKELTTQPPPEARNRQEKKEGNTER